MDDKSTEDLDEDGLPKFTEEDDRYMSRFKVSWDEIIDQSTLLAEHEVVTNQYIESFMGYMPEPYITIPVEPILRSTVDGYLQGKLTREEFEKEFEQPVKFIRNRDMERHGYVMGQIFGTEEFNTYNTELVIFKEQARRRLNAFFGFEIDLEDSLYAEVFLRQIFQFDCVHEQTPFFDMDYRAATIMQYRQAFRKSGLDAARNTPLLGPYWTGKS